MRLLLSQGIVGTERVADLDLGRAERRPVDAKIMVSPAEFWVRRPNVQSYEVEFGQSGAEFPEFGMICYGQKLSDGSTMCVDLYKVKAAGMPISFKEKGWSEWSGSMKTLFDTTKGAVGKLIKVQVAA